MATFKCPNCSANLTDDSKFCKYCGAKIDDGIKRVEVKIDKKIEDVAEIQRAGYEEKESQLRQKQMKHELNVGKTKRIILLTLLCICVVVSIPVVIINPTGKWATIGAFAFIGGVCIIAIILYQLIRGKW